MRTKSGRKSAYFRLFGERYRINDCVAAGVFTLPAVILGLVFVITPMVISLGFAFTDAGLLKLDAVKFNNFANFKSLIGDNILWQAFKNTMEFVVKVVPLQMTMAVVLALILNSNIKFNTFLRRIKSFWSCKINTWII